MSDRRLRPWTIIPPDLYVERDADRQLHRTILGMGRPAYILVARQMGKTNLLLNARRSLENEDTKFVYMDLSEKPKSLRAYYRRIIETALDVHPNIFQRVDIAAIQRYSQETADYAADYRDYESALRSMLKMYSGRIIIVLDEIDALGGVAFSDRIFSQIRSMYFSRTNHPVFERLTYVLSGVAEPSDLIKDRSVSPFNIGEKIYLNDFSVSEFRTFISKAGLKVSQEITERVFWWASGNPRITWDICAEIEDLTLSGGSPLVADVDDIVRKLYLTAFDRAPVDHIRTIVSENREIREALNQMQRGAGALLSDSVRNRLYLAGIAKPSVTSELVAIKNRIIEEAVSDRWLESLQKSLKGALPLARLAFEDRDYKEAALQYDVLRSQSDAQLQKADNLRFGMSLYYTHQWERAIEILEVSKSDSEEPGLIEWRLGRAYQSLGRYPEAIASYSRVVSDTSDNRFVQLAKALSALCMVQYDPKQFRVEAERLSREVLEAKGDLSGTASIENARAQAASTLAHILRNENDPVGAMDILEKALVESTLAYRPVLVLQLAEIARQNNGIPNPYLRELARTFIESANKAPEQDDAGETDLTNEYTYRALVELRLFGEDADFNRLFAHAVERRMEGAQSEHELYQRMLMVARDTNSEQNLGPLLNDILAKFEGQPKAFNLWRNALRTLIISKRAKVEKIYISKFENLLKTDTQRGEIVAADYLAAGFILAAALQANDDSALASATNAFTILRQPPDPGLRYGYAFILYFMVIKCLRLEDVTSAGEYARELLFLLDQEDAERPKSTFYAQSVRESLRKFAEDRLFDANAVLRNELKRYGRNDRVLVRYNDGITASKKFKQVERDLVLGRCIIVQ